MGQTGLFALVTALIVADLDPKYRPIKRGQRYLGLLPAHENLLEMRSPTDIQRNRAIGRAQRATAIRQGRSLTLAPFHAEILAFHRIGAPVLMLSRIADKRCDCALKRIVVTIARQ